MATPLSIQGAVSERTTNPRDSLETLRSQLQEDSAAVQRSPTVPPDVEDHVRALGRPADVNASLSIDPGLAGELWEAAAAAQNALVIVDEEARRIELRFTLEQMLDALDALLESEPFSRAAPLTDVLKRTEVLLQAPQHDLAEILGVSVRTLQRWISGDGEPATAVTDRVRIVGQLVNQLRHFLTPSGVVSWFRREHPAFGKAPIELLDDPATYPELLNAASAPRSMPL